MKLIIGSRGSPLALCQAEWVREKLKELYPEGQFLIKEIKTQGDKILDVALARVGGKGFFTKEIEESLLRGEIDLAAHSLKDLPTEIPPGLFLGAVTLRSEAHDVLVSKDALNLSQLPEGAKIGTSSLRRRAQLLKFRPDFQVMDLRGNLNTRLRKLRELDLNAIVIAGAGLKRMGEEDRITEIIPFSIILPAAGQGALGIEIREGNTEIKEMVAKLDDRDSRVETEAERSFLEKLGGGCQVPVGALGQLRKGNLSLQGIILSLDGRGSVQSELTGKAEDARNLGERLAEELLASGGAEMLKEVIS
ncbi:MAG: hydroxymethylbilane synthase [Nitrospirae bacterium]|nr:hydroxymethylbilane synthase [Nitrospirota bacterium]